MTSRLALALALATVLSAVALASAAPASHVSPPRTVPTTGDPVSYLHPVEAHHSLAQPLDQSQVYWNFGGSTVSTRRFIRLTPSTQDRRGWLWNEYPLEADNWECEFKFEVFSKPHFGGDGFGFWVLTGEHDPAFTTEPDALTGPVFGMRADFQGFGVLFDVYDNDNKRDNPSIFVLRNDEGKPVQYNHDTDYLPDMVTKTGTVDGLNVANKAHTQHKCLGEFRNTGKPSKVLIKFLHKVLHVYLDVADGVGYKFCLAVTLEKSYKDYHIAFSAATGQVADVHDIHEVSTRYLAASDKDFDDSTLPSVGNASSAGSWGTAFWGLLVLAGAGLTGLGAYEVYSMGQLKHIDAVHVCEHLNRIALPHFALHWAVTALLLVALRWLPLLVNLPLAAYRVYAVSKRQHILNPSLVAQQNHNARLYAAVAVYVVSELLFLHAFSQ